MSGPTSLRYNCTALLGINKKGILKPDADGYYEINVGGFNVHNFGGKHWPLGDAAKLFAPGSSLRRRLEGGVVRAELGHPRREGMNEIDFYQRLNEIHEDKVCGHFSEMRLDYNNFKSKSGFPMVAVVAKVRPSGPFGNVLKDSLDNPKEETCFSIRAGVEDVGNDRFVQDIVTYDYVNEGGITIARKYYSMALEDIHGVQLDVEDLIVTPSVLNAACESAHRHMGLESADTQRLVELRETLGWNRSANGIMIPSYL